jgi:hypothetical protein
MQIVTLRHCSLDSIVTCISIARQRLCKHIPVKRMCATKGRPLLGNGAVNTPL